MFYIKREVEGKVKRLLGTPEIIAIFGARQVGKTTLMKRLYELVDGSKIFLDFEDPEVVGLFDEDIKAFAKLYVEGYDFIFFDEFQYSRNGGKNLKYLYDTFRKKFFISGSSSLELSVKLPSYLVGRIFILELFPLSLREFFNFRAGREFEAAVEKAKKFQPIPSAIHESLLRLFDEFMIFGGYPRVVVADDLSEKREVLRNLLITYLSKDVKGFFRVATDRPFNKLMKAVSLQIGNLINYSELANLSGTSLRELKRHLSILEETYIIRLVKPFFRNRRTEIVKNPKVYFMDNGFRNVVIRDFRDISVRADSGSIAENLVCAELVKQGWEVRFWRSKGGAEVDFVVEEQGNLTPVEVKFSTTVSAGKSLISFVKKYKPKVAFVLCRGNLKVDKWEGTKFIFLPVYLADNLRDFL